MTGLGKTAVVLLAVPLLMAGGLVALGVAALLPAGACPVETVGPIRSGEATTTVDPTGNSTLAADPSSPTPSGAAATGRPDACAGWVLPLPAGSYQITSGYGPRWGTFHYGVDLAAPPGTPIYAAAS